MTGGCSSVTATRQSIILLTSDNYKTRENYMYMDTPTVIGITIALGASLVMMFILAYANAKLIEENRYLRRRLRAWRKSCENHVEVPF